MFYELYADRNVLHGGLWFDPDELEFIEVTDMDSAAGHKGVTMLERGGAPITEMRLQAAAENTGMFYVEPPPAPPEGRKHWLVRPWEPRPKPGYLFWVATPPRGPHVIRAWEIWTEFKKEGGKFEELPEEVQADVLQGAGAVHAYAGISDAEQTYVIDRARRKSKLETAVWPGAVYSSNPERAVLKILKDWGVSHHE